MLNILAYHGSDEWIVHIIPRRVHRPACYFAEGDEKILLSPASVDIGGVFITPREEDFNRITAADIAGILCGGVPERGRIENFNRTIIMTENRTPEISVGIVSGSGLTFTLDGEFTYRRRRQSRCQAVFTALARDGRLLLKSENETVEAATEITLTPSAYDSCSFTLHAVTIGVDFHWQRNEDQTFRGMLKFIARGGQVTAINILPVEDYLRQCDIIGNECHIIRRASQGACSHLQELAAGAD